VGKSLGKRPPEGGDGRTNFNVKADLRERAVGCGGRWKWHRTWLLAFETSHMLTTTSRSSGIRISEIRGSKFCLGIPYSDIFVTVLSPSR
jgi:hypothetical protein